MGVKPVFIAYNFCIILAVEGISNCGESREPFSFVLFATVEGCCVAVVVDKSGLLKL